MNKSKKTVLLILFFILILFSNKRLIAADFEKWTFVGGQTKIRNLNFYFHSANFFRHGSDFFLTHTQLSLDFASKKSISLGIGYKQEYVESPERWTTEYRPMLHLYYNKNWGHLNFKDRSRWELRIIDGKLINRYRNQIQFSFHKYKGLLPYFSTEFSIYFDKLEYTRQRTIIGTELPLRKANLNLFLGHQFNKDSSNVWKTKIILGTGLIFKF